MAAHKISWTIAMTKFLINCYESNEFLYNTRHQDYTNKSKRSVMYAAIARRINENFDVQCTEQDLKKKVNGLRTQYQTEKLKITKSLKSGADADSIYTPTAYWFPLLKFLDISVTADDSFSNLDEISNGNYSQSQSSPEPRPGSSQSSDASSQRRRTKTNSDDILLQQATRTMHEMTEIARKKQKLDCFDTFGSFVASELRSISLIKNERFSMTIKTKIQKYLLEAWEDIEREPTYTEIPTTSVASPSSTELKVSTTPHTSTSTVPVQTSPQESINLSSQTPSLYRCQVTPGTSDTDSHITHIQNEEDSYTTYINEDILTQALNDAGVTEWNSIQLQIDNIKE